MNRSDIEHTKKVLQSIERIEKFIDKQQTYTHKLQVVCYCAKEYLKVTENVFMATNDDEKEEICRAKLWEAIKKVEGK